MKTVRTRYFVGTLLALAVNAAGAENLCKLGEETVFTCTTARPEMKTVSLCAGPMNSTRPDEQWLQFRLGRKGKLEQSYPQEKAGSLQRFEGTRSRDKDRLSYVFVNGKSLYELRLEQFDLDRPLAKTRLKADLRIHDGKQETTLKCPTLISEEYWTRLSQFAPLTRQPSGAEGGLVSQFQKQPTK